MGRAVKWMPFIYYKGFWNIVLKAHHHNEIGDFKMSDGCLSLVWSLNRLLCPRAPKMWMSVKAAPRTSLIQRGCVKCRRHISVECIQLYNWLGIPFPSPALHPYSLVPAVSDREHPLLVDEHGSAEVVPVVEGGHPGSGVRFTLLATDDLTILTGHCRWNTQREWSQEGRDEDIVALWIVFIRIVLHHIETACWVKRLNAVISDVVIC